MTTSKKPGARGPKDATPLGATQDDDSAHNVWLAGLGALAKAQAEGNKMFDALVKDGLAMQRKTQALAEQRLAAASQRMAEMTAQAGGGALKWDRLESLFDDRVARALGRLGMPTAGQLAELNARVERLEAALQVKVTPEPASDGKTTRRARAAGKAA